MRVVRTVPNLRVSDVARANGLYSALSGLEVVYERVVEAGLEIIHPVTDEPCRGAFVGSSSATPPGTSSTSSPTPEAPTAVALDARLLLGAGITAEPVRVGGA